MTTLIFPSVDADTAWLAFAADRSLYSDGKFIVPSLELDIETGHAWLDEDDEGQTCETPKIWHRRAFSWRLPAVRPEAMRELLVELLPLVETVWAGTEIEWDGSNICGRLSPEAAEHCGCGQRCRRQRRRQGRQHSHEHAAADGECSGAGVSRLGVPWCHCRIWGSGAAAERPIRARRPGAEAGGGFGRHLVRPPQVGGTPSGNASGFGLCGGEDPSRMNKRDKQRAVKRQKPPHWDGSWRWLSTSL